LKQAGTFINDGTLESISLNLSENGKIIEKYVLDFTLNISTRPNDKVIKEVTKHGMDTVFTEYFTIRNENKKKLNDYTKDLYSAMTHHLIRLIQVCQLSFLGVDSEMYNFEHDQQEQEF
jgi:hypothetical protein